MAFEFKCPQRVDKRIHARVMPYMSHDDKTYHESHAPLQAIDSSTGEPLISDVE
jgi:hypothetical protein